MRLDDQFATLFEGEESPRNHSSVFEQNSTLSDPGEDLAASFAEIDNDRKELARRYNALREEAILRIEQLAAMFNIGPDEIDLSGEGSGRNVSNPLIKVRVPVKYRGPHGETWSGRGKLPNWLKLEIAKGAKREDFLA